MAKIYRRSDRVKVKIDDVIVTIAPLSLEAKVEATEYLGRGKAAGNYPLIQKGLSVLLKNSIKNIDGVEGMDGKPYTLQFENDVLTDDCLSDLYNLELHKKLVMVCSSLIKNIPSEFTDENGNLIEGVEIVKTENGATPHPN